MKHHGIGIRRMSCAVSRQFPTAMKDSAAMQRSDSSLRKESGSESKEKTLSAATICESVFFLWMSLHRLFCSGPFFNA